MTTEQQEIGALIRAKRKEKHWTQAKLAEQLNLTRDAIFAYEKGKVKIIPFDKRLELSALLDVPFIELCYSNELYYKVFGNSNVVAHTKAIKADMQKAEEATQKQYNESILSKTSEPPLKKDDEVDALAQTIHDEIVNEIMKSFSKDTIKDYIYAALEKRLKESTTPPDQNKKK